MARTMKKRTSLDDFASTAVYPEAGLNTDEQTPPSESENAATDDTGTAPKPKKPKQKVTTTFRPAGGLEGPVWERLWQINLNEGRRGMNSILNEAIDLFLKSRGQPSIEQLTGKKAY